MSVRCSRSHAPTTVWLEALPEANHLARLFDDRVAEPRKELVERHVGSVSQLQKALEAFKGDEADAVIAISDAMVDSRIQYVIEMANDLKLPTMLYDPGAVSKGGLATYSADYREVGRLTAKYVHRILQGAKPADFAVEGADKLSLVINLKTAKQLGLKIPESLLARADKIIE